MMAVASNATAFDSFPHKSVYRPEIDGMRALAVIAVITNHFNKDLLPSGYLGVDMFFVISGYVITSSCANRTRKSLLDFFLEFYSRRIKRLVPTLVLCVCFTSILICLFSSDPRTSLLTGVTSLFGVSNIYLLGQSTDYFAASAELNVFTHTWSLGVEEQFYFLFPFFVWFTGFGRQAATGVRNILAIVGAIAVASVMAFIYLSGSNQYAAYFLMPTRLWELGVGCLLFSGLEDSGGLLSDLLFKVRPTVVISLIVATFFVPLQFSVQATISIVLFTTLLIFSLRSQTTAYDFLTRPAVVYTGLLSYSLYLWHWSVLSISRWTIGIHWWSAPIQIGLMLLLAMGSYRFIENPLRRAEWSSQRWKSIGYGLGASVVASVFLVVLEKPMEGRLYIGNKLILAEATASQLLNSTWITEKGERSSELSQQIKSCLMTPQYLTGDAYRPKPNVDAEFIRKCTHSLNVPSPRKVLLVGDSFAEVAAKHIALAASLLGYEFKFINGYSCPFPLRLAFIKSSAKQVCHDIDEIVLTKEIIGGLGRGDLVVLQLDFPKTEYLSYSGSSIPPVDAYDEEIISFYSNVFKQGAQLLVIGANPTLNPRTLESAQARWFQLAGNNYFNSADTPQTVYFLAQDRHLRETLPEHTGLYYFSTAAYLCETNNMCTLKNGTKLLYKDCDHISPYAYDLFFPTLLSYMSRILKVIDK
jgi:peptidoglycan/LPS O-acetylase OafA/YrhL